MELVGDYGLGLGAEALVGVSPGPGAESPETRGSHVPCERAREMDAAAQERKDPPFLHNFVLSRPSRDHMMPSHTGEGHLLYSILQFRC